MKIVNGTMQSKDAPELVGIVENHMACNASSKNGNRSTSFDIEENIATEATKTIRLSKFHLFTLQKTFAANEDCPYSEVSGNDFKDMNWTWACSINTDYKVEWAFLDCQRNGILTRSCNTAKQMNDSLKNACAAEKTQTCFKASALNGSAILCSKIFHLRRKYPSHKIEKGMYGVLTGRHLTALASLQQLNRWLLPQCTT